MKFLLFIFFFIGTIYSSSSQANKSIFVRTGITFSPAPILAYEDAQGFDLTSVENKHGYEFSVRLENNENKKWEIFKQVNLGFHRYSLNYHYDENFAESPFVLENVYVVFKDITYLSLDLGITYNISTSGKFSLSSYLAPSAGFGFGRRVNYSYAIPNVGNPGRANTLFSQRRQTYPKKAFVAVNFGLITQVKIKQIRTTFEPFVSWSNATSLSVQTELIGKDRVIQGSTTKDHIYLGLGIGFNLSDFF